MEIGFNWKQFLVTLLGTSIGVALTFALNGVHERRVQERAQRLTAVMIIHDIDNTVEALRVLKHQEERQHAMAQLWVDQPDSLKTAPYDSVYQVLHWLLNVNHDYRFDDSKERIFHSSQDAWQNLGSIKFIDNVQSFYYTRRELQDNLNQDEMFVYPVPRKEFRQLAFEHPFSSQEEYHELVRDFVKQKLSDKTVRYFLDCSDSRLQYLNQHIDHWTQANEENKFLMGISDREMDQYVNSITHPGEAVTARKMLGTWMLEHATNNSLSSYEFRRDSLFLYRICYAVPWNTEIWSGDFKQNVQVEGKWWMQGDSLVMVMDWPTADIRIDLTEMVPVEGKKDSLDAWAAKYQERTTEAWRQQDESTRRLAFKVRIDDSNDKLEWTGEDGHVVYTTRKK